MNTTIATFEGRDDTVLAGNDLAKLTKLASEQLALTAAVEETEKKLESLKEQLKRVAEQEIPELFETLGLSEIKLGTGQKITIRKLYFGKIMSPESFTWLRDNGFDEIVKHVIAVDLGKGDDKLAKKITSALDKLQVDYDDKETVHPQTLKAFIKERMEAGEPLPTNLFEVTVVNKAQVK